MSACEIVPSVGIALPYLCRIIHSPTVAPDTYQGYIMSKVFRITPKTIKRVNNTVLTPEMEIIVTTEHHTQDPFYNGAKEIITMYMDRYGFDYKRANATKAWFNYERLD